MEGSQERSPGEDYFNDLSQQPTNRSEEDRRESQDDENGQVPKPKRIACVLCRKRKLKCDGTKPSCGTCTRLQHDCSYDEVRRKSGPKRGYVKALEARLAQVETLLKTQDDQPPTTQNKSNGMNCPDVMDSNDTMMPEFSQIGIGKANVNVLPHLAHTRSQHDFPQQAAHPHTMLSAVANGDSNLPSEEPFPWEMIGLGLDEPLPNQDVINELNQLYFEKVHLSMPMIHRPRYYAAMNLAPHMRPPVCLRYAMWANAAAVSDKYEALQEHFYQRARKYIQQDEMKSHGESMISVAHCQTWILIATLEFKSMFFPRAWMSSGRACRLSQMMGLHRIDGSGLDVKQCLPPPKDWTEREERRRTFWLAFCVDRYSSIGTGWPMIIEERDIMTVLPADEQAFELSRPAKTINLSDALNPSGPPNLSSLAGVVLLASLFGRNLTHLHRPTPDDQDDDLNGDFWKRHRAMDNILLNTSLALPDALRLPNGLNNPNNVFLNMNIHTSTICLHQAAIFKADKNRMPPRISAESKIRCITAAAEIASIMRQISHMDLSSMNPFISFCLYVAARVFVQYLKSRPKDAQVKASLQFLLSAMHVIKRKNPLTESFLVQLDVDLEGAGLEDAHSLRGQTPKTGFAAQIRGHHLATREGSDATAVPTNRSKIPTYGNNGLAVYTQPGQGTLTPNSGSGPSDTFGYTTESMAADALPYLPTHIELPNRQRSPGSYQSSNMMKSPSTFNPEMDTSPDENGAGDNRTPASTNHASSHTSSTPYSPANPHLATDPLLSTDMHTDPLNSIFDQSAFPDFEINKHFPTTTADSQQQGFVMPQDWSTTATGLTPGATAGIGILNGNVGDMMSMSDSDWNQVLESFVGWESSQHEMTVQEMSTARRT